MWLCDLAAHINKKTTEVNGDYVATSSATKVMPTWESYQMNADGPSNTVSSNLTCYTIFYKG